MSLALAILAAAALAGPAPAARPRDDTAWLQARLDIGGEVRLAPLPDGACYATRGLWIWRDDTSLVSDGACLVSLGSGPVRLHGGGTPIAADGVLYVNRTDGTARPPERIRIAGLRIEVPKGVPSYGIEIQGRDVELDHVTVTGEPKDALLVGGYANGDGYASHVFVHDSVFTGGARN